MVRPCSGPASKGSWQEAHEEHAMSHKLSRMAVIGIAEIGNSAAIRFESAPKASGRSPRFV